jgi:hypothetical protein
MRKTTSLDLLEAEEVAQLVCPIEAEFPELFQEYR